MKNIKINILLGIILLSVGVFAQSTRSLVNEGVEKYKKQEFAEAEVNFKKGIESEVDNFHSHFNLGDALYKQERYEDAMKAFQTSLMMAPDQDSKAGVYHNIGNSLLKANKLKESIEAYKNALKLNPDDFTTKYNLSYARKKLEEQQKQKQNQQNKDQQNKDKNKDQQKQDQNKNQDKNKDQKDKQNKDQQNKQDQQNKNQQNKDKQGDQNKQKQQPKPNEISKEEAKRILNALKNKESDLQKKLRVKKGKVVKKEKDW